MLRPEARPLCPLRDFRPCVGRQCAWAVGEDLIGGMTYWRCGVPTVGPDATTHVRMADYEDAPRENEWPKDG